MKNNPFTQLCVWPATVVGKEKIDEFVEFMKTQFGATVKYECEVITLPGDGGEGGRNDLFFYIHSESIPSFSVARLEYGIRWWEDVLLNQRERIYPEEIYNKYPDTWKEAETNKVITKKVNLNLVGLEGNAFSLIAQFRTHAKKQGWQPAEIDAVVKECQSGDYDHLLQTLMSVCESAD